MELETLLLKISELKNELDGLRPLKKEIEQRILQKFRLDWNYHSNSIEGNVLTYGETRTFLLHGLTAQGKPLKDHLDIKGHNDAIIELEDIIHNARPLTEVAIRQLHEIILPEPYENPAITSDGLPTIKRINPGKYKTQPNHVKTITGEIFYFASPEETPAKMGDLISWYRESKENSEINPVVLASEFHYRFVRIHPFDDGNGRMARLLMNLVLMSNGFPPVIIRAEDKENYFRSLQQADGGALTPFYEYISEQLLHSLDLFIKGARGLNIDEPSDFQKRLTLLKQQLEPKLFHRGKTEAEIQSVGKNVLSPIANSLKNTLDELSKMFYNVDWALFSIVSASAKFPARITSRSTTPEEVQNYFGKSVSTNEIFYAFSLTFVRLKVDGTDLTFRSIVSITYGDYKFQLNFQIVSNPKLDQTVCQKVISNRSYINAIPHDELFQTPMTPYDSIINEKMNPLIEEWTLSIGNKILQYIESKIAQ